MPLKERDMFTLIPDTIYHLAILKNEKPKKCVSECTKYSLAKSRPLLFLKTSEACFNEERAMK